ncbi:hypothetical protein ACOYR1_11380 [Thalassotalea piscium]
MMTLFSWYLTSQSNKNIKQLSQKTSQAEAMWPIAKVRQTPQRLSPQLNSSNKTNITVQITNDGSLRP